MRLGATVDGSAEGPDASLRSCLRSLLDFENYIFKENEGKLTSFIKILLRPILKPVGSRTIFFSRGL